jgi:hypothetical protein
LEIGQDLVEILKATVLTNCGGGLADADRFDIEPLLVARHPEVRARWSAGNVRMDLDLVTRAPVGLVEEQFPERGLHLPVISSERAAEVILCGLGQMGEPVFDEIAHLLEILGRRSVQEREPALVVPGGGGVSPR